MLSQENLQSALKDTISLDEVVLTGTAVKFNKSNIPIAVSVIDNELIPESIETAILPALNRLVPGL